MRFVRFGTPGKERPGVLDAQGGVRDLSELVSDLDGAALADLSWAEGLDPESLPLAPEGARLGPCVTGVGKLICIGLNYADHAAETGAKVPSEPMIFMKATSSLNGPYDPVELPRTSVKTDWEVELAMVIGKPAKYVSAEEALDYVAGFTLFNDLSERDFQKYRGGQFTKGKSCDGYGPLGPWLVTPDEVGDPGQLKLWTRVNGELMQDGSTSDMIFNVPFVLSYLSQFMTLNSGDIISTGTPAGVGLGMEPQRFLKPGDEVQVGIEGLGEQRNLIQSAR